jgi:hypothetical protein
LPAEERRSNGRKFFRRPEFIVQNLPREEELSKKQRKIWQRGIKPKVNIGLTLSFSSNVITELLTSSQT